MKEAALGHHHSKLNDDKLGKEDIEDDEELTVQNMHSLEIVHRAKQDISNTKSSQKSDLSQTANRSLPRHLNKSLGKGRSRLTSKELNEQRELKECTFRPNVALTARMSAKRLNEKPLVDILYEDAKRLSTYKDGIKSAVSVYNDHIEIAEHEREGRENKGKRKIV